MKKDDWLYTETFLITRQARGWVLGGTCCLRAGNDHLESLGENRYGKNCGLPILFVDDVSDGMHKQGSKEHRNTRSKIVKIEYKEQKLSN